jgi:hypothetical protein
MSETNEKKNETAVQTAEQVHPLMKWKPRIFKNLREWRTAFDEAETASERGGLLQQLIADGAKKAHHPLHDDIVKNHNTIAELMILLMKLADGYKRWENFLEPGEHKHKNERELIAKDRQYVAQRAFEVLCQLYFNETWRDPSKDVPGWRVVFWNYAVFQKVLWFIRQDEHPLRWKKHWLHNLKDPIFVSGREHSQELFKEFLLAVSILGWDQHLYFFSCAIYEARTEAVKKFVGASGQFIEMLFAIERLDTLIGKDLDTASIETLTRLSMQPYNVWVKNEGMDGGHWDVGVMPGSLEEASASPYDSIYNTLVTPNAQVALAATLVLAHQARVAKEEETLRRIEEASDRDALGSSNK